VQGLNAFPKSSEPTIHEVNVVHLAWDVMVGIATLLFLLSIYYAVYWLFRRRLPMQKVFLLCASGAGVAAILALEAGWVVTEVGRQPWIVHNYMTVEQGATTNGGVWITFLVIMAVYLSVGVTLVLVMRRMSRRSHEQGEVEETDVPYGPRPLTQPEEVSVS